MPLSFAPVGVPLLCTYSVCACQQETPHTFITIRSRHIKRSRRKILSRISRFHLTDAESVCAYLGHDRMVRPERGTHHVHHHHHRIARHRDHRQTRHIRWRRLPTHPLLRSIREGWTTRCHLPQLPHPRPRPVRHGVDGGRLPHRIPHLVRCSGDVQRRPRSLIH